MDIDEYDGPKEPSSYFYYDGPDIETLEEIIDLIPENATTVICINKGMTSLKGINLLHSNVSSLIVSYNKIESIEHIVDNENIIYLDVSFNPCFEFFHKEFNRNVRKAREYYKNDGFDVKQPDLE